MLYGSKASYALEACVLGISLRGNYQLGEKMESRVIGGGSEVPLILLVTDDVPSPWRIVLKKCGWKLNTVQYVEACNKLYEESRFVNTFTKFDALALEQFEKVVLLDCDLLVRKEVDSLFDRAVPSACKRDASGDYPDCALISPEEFYRWPLESYNTGGINAGVIVLQPDREVFDVICGEIQDPHYPGHFKSRMPEQDYLSRFWADRWHHLSVLFNYQPHQMALCDRRGLERCGRLEIPYEDVRIVHFSALPKPRDKMISVKYCDMTRTTFLEELTKRYSSGLVSHRNYSGPSKRSQESIEAHLRTVTYQSTMEWFEVYDKLVEMQPQV